MVAVVCIVWAIVV